MSMLQLCTHVCTQCEECQLMGNPLILHCCLPDAEGMVDVSHVAPCLTMFSH